MSYTKIENQPVERIVEAMDLALPGDVTMATRDLLLLHGTLVEFDGTAERAWVSSIVQDKPETMSIDVFTVAFAVSGNTVMFRPSGYPVAVTHWHAADSVTVANEGIDAVRREQMLLSLGETDGVFEEDPPATVAFKRQVADARNIRKLASGIAQLLSPPTEVL